jgi:hypothetical protein
MSGQVLNISFVDRHGSQADTVSPGACVVAGWTGRDPIALEKHIVELEALGVKRPAATPIFYRVGRARLTVSAAIEAVGDASSGEVEYVLLQRNGRLWVGVGSDHTDRDVETYGVTVAKQLCDKPIAPTFWPIDEVEAHWDSLTLRSFITVGGEKILYQQGKLIEMLGPRDLISRFTGGPELPEGTMMFCGTFDAIGGIRPSSRFDFEIEDSILGRTIRHGYDIVSLPIAG